MIAIAMFLGLLVIDVAVIFWCARQPRKNEWEYGTYGLHRPGRRNRRTGEVQFVLWHAGEQGHEEDFWHATDPYWWPSFKAVTE